MTKLRVNVPLEISFQLLNERLRFHEVFIAKFFVPLSAKEESKILIELRAHDKATRIFK